MVFPRRSGFEQRPLLSLQREQSRQSERSAGVSGLARTPFAPAPTGLAVDRRLRRPVLAGPDLWRMGMAIRPESRGNPKHRAGRNEAGPRRANRKSKGNRSRTTTIPLARVRVRAFEPDARRHQLSGDGHREYSVAVDCSAGDLSVVVHSGVRAPADFPDGLAAVAAAGDGAGRHLSNAHARDPSGLAGGPDSPAAPVPGRDDGSWTAGRRTAGHSGSHGILFLDFARRRAGRRL